MYNFKTKGGLNEPFFKKMNIKSTVQECDATEVQLYSSARPQKLKTTKASSLCNKQK